MKRLPVFVITAAIAMTGAAAIPTQAAVKAIVIGGNAKTCGSPWKQQWGAGGSGCSRPACPTPGSCNLPNIGVVPDQSLPGQGGGSCNLPDIGVVPDQSQPGQGGGNLPDIGVVPDQSLPGQGGEGLPDIGVPDQPQQDDSSFTAQVAALVNEERAKAGLSPLTVNSGAASAALIRAREIETSFSHTRPDGSSFSTALTQSGVSFRSSGENIAYGQRTPEEVMKGWMNSPGHRANIMNQDFTAIGVGYYQSNTGTGYWTQLFIR